MIGIPTTHALKGAHTMTTNATGKLATYRLVVKATGVHMGFVVIDPERERCYINAGEFKAFSRKALFAFARVNDAICYALANDHTRLSVPLRTVGIGTDFDVVGF